MLLEGGYTFIYLTTLNLGRGFLQRLSSKVDHFMFLAIFYGHNILATFTLKYMKVILENISFKVMQFIIEMIAKLSPS